MEIFEVVDSSKEDGSFLCYNELRLNWGIASEKGTCIPRICVCVESRYVAGDAADGESVESDDIFTLGSLILSLLIRRESLSL